MLLKKQRAKAYWLTLAFAIHVVCLLYLHFGEKLLSKEIVPYSHNLTDLFDTKQQQFTHCSNSLSNASIGWSFISTQKTDVFNCSSLITVGDEKVGRLGNKIFQIAALIGIADKNGFSPVLRSGHELFQVFDMMAINIGNVIITNRKNNTYSVACRYNNKFEYLPHSKNWSLSGYFQSWKYFSGAEDKVRYAFRFKKDIIENVERFMQPIKKKRSLSIGIHVRRGDFASTRLLELGYAVAPQSYVYASTEYFRQKYKHVQFFVASDNIKWCQKYLGNIKNVHFSNFTEPKMDMALLSSCDHVIITSGSFGWWSAWLSEGTVVYYKGFPKPDSWLDTRFNKTDYYPSGWIGMD